MLYSKIKPSFLFYLHQSMVTNEHKYVTKNDIKCYYGRFVGRFDCNIFDS